MKALTIIIWVALGIVSFDVLKSVLMAYQEAFYNKKCLWLFRHGFELRSIISDSTCRFVFAKGDIKLDSLFVRANPYKSIVRFVVEKELEVLDER